jgi:class 3 adenylate cyclase
MSKGIPKEDDGEELKLTNMRAANKATPPSIENTNVHDHTKTTQKKSAEAKSFINKLDNILDFNLKFKWKKFEKVYNRSFLPVTRLIFINYLFYMMLFVICWLIYFAIDENKSSLTLSGVIFTKILVKQGSAQLKLQNSSLNDVDDGSLKNAIVFNRTHEISDCYMIVIYYLIAFLVILLVVFGLVFTGELRESRYRKLERKLKDLELSTKVDCQTAEKDLKKAMEDVIQMEKENSNVKAELNAKFAEISKLRHLYSRVAYPVAFVLVFLMYFLCIFAFIYPPASLTVGSHFIWFCQATLLAYLVYPFHMGVSMVLGISASILFEICAVWKQVNSNQSLFMDESALGDRSAATSTPDSSENVADSMYYYLQSQIIIFAFIKLLLHACLHIIGAYLKLSLQAIKRDTFLKVAHMHKAHMTTQQDKEITERMIKSIMPPLFTHVFGKPEEFKESVNCVHQMRPLFIYPVKHLSILFADIVGFTRMSSTKTAEELVYLLNDLYGRFDRLCETCGCEKISTLGDCYYCVSGCLNGRADHAKCCVEMGLLMVKEIELFNKMHNVDVNMRVGVHTGNALCGFIGGKRFRFDVWSSDVTLANKMESSGRPGQVHISEDTYKLLEGKYNVEPGEKYSGKMTYFVLKDVRKETVADRLMKLNENGEQDAAQQPEKTATLDEKHSQFKQQPLRQQSLDGDLKIYKNNSKQMDDEEEENELYINETNETSEANKTHEADEESMLLLAVQNTTFFQPEVNLCTIRFRKASIEKEFQAYLLGLSSVGGTSAASLSRHSIRHDEPRHLRPYHHHHHHHNSQRSTEPSGDNNGMSGLLHASKSVWTYPQNALFLSLLVSFIVNLCVSTAYLMTYIVSSITTFEYKLTDNYKLNLLIILGIFFLLFVIQTLFLIFYFMKCSKLLNKHKQERGSTAASAAASGPRHSSSSYSSDGSRRNCLFDLPTSMRKVNSQELADAYRGINTYNGSSSAPLTNRQLLKGVQGGGMVGEKTASHQLRKQILLRYILLHVISIALLSVVPIFILSTGVPVLCDIIAHSFSSYLTSQTSSSSVSSPLTSSDTVDPKSNNNYYLQAENSKRLNVFGMYVYFSYAVALIHFCSFVQTSSFIKTLFALVFAIIYAVIGTVGMSDKFNDIRRSGFIVNRYTNSLGLRGSNVTNIASAALTKSEEIGQLMRKSFNLSAYDYSFKDFGKFTFNFYSRNFLSGFFPENSVILIDLLFLLLLIWFINRQCELIQRLSFECDQNARKKVAYAKEQKELANWLIEVVLPAHVVDNVKEKKQYSRNFNCVGVLFVSLCNFGEFFEETYAGGRELLRILNEITVDFDRLFDDPKYKDIEKIKSIGSTIMIASGLGPDTMPTQECCKYTTHLYDLVDFALELNEKLEAFNNEAMSVCHFKFQMRMGFNCGPVTAGIIGTERLLYDIWGDTVNVASRMDSTGHAGLLQTPKEVASMLGGKYKFYERGEMQIKGKDKMITYFMDPKQNKKSNS